MKGLILKDICLLKGRKQSLIFLLVIGLLMGMTMDGSFVVGYVCMLTTIFLIGTVSYDEFDNGYAFLLTLPVTRRSYVNAKYLLCLAGGISGILLGGIIYVICSLFKGTAIDTAVLQDIASFLPVLALIVGLCLPVQLKYGAERSRMVLALVGGACIAIGLLAKRLFPDGGGALEALNSLSDAAVLASLACASVLILAVSYFICLKIMQNKEL